MTLARVSSTWTEKRVVGWPLNLSPYGMRVGMHEAEDQAVPPGWTYNPSSWGERCAPFLLDYPDESAIGSIAIGLATIALSCIRGTLTNRFGGGWSVL